MQRVYIDEEYDVLDSFRNLEEFGEWSESRGRYTRNVYLLKDDDPDWRGEPVFFKDDQGKVGIGDSVHLIVCRYSAGDSFGCSRGNEEVLLVAGDQETLSEALKAIDVADKAGEFSFDFRGKSISIPWRGYFENLEDLRVETIFITKEE